MRRRLAGLAAISSIHPPFRRFVSSSLLCCPRFPLRHFPPPPPYPFPPPFSFCSFVISLLLLIVCRFSLPLLAVSLPAPHLHALGCCFVLGAGLETPVAAGIVVAAAPVVAAAAGVITAAPVVAAAAGIVAAAPVIAAVVLAVAIRWGWSLRRMATNSSVGFVSSLLG